MDLFNLLFEVAITLPIDESNASSGVVASSCQWGFLSGLRMSATLYS